MTLYLRFVVISLLFFPLFQGCFLFKTVQPQQPGLCSKTVYVPNASGNGCSQATVYFQCPGKVHHVVTGGIEFSSDGDDGESDTEPGHESLVRSECVRLDTGMLHLSGLFYIQIDCEKIPEADQVTYQKTQWDQSPLDTLKIMAKVFDKSTGMEVQSILPNKKVEKHVSYAKRDFHDKTLFPSYKITPQNGLFPITDSNYTYVCLDMDDGQGMQPHCAALINVTISFPATAGKDYSLVIFAAEHFSGYHNHGHVIMDYFCLCPYQKYEYFDPADYVDNHLDVFAKEGVEITPEMKREFENYVKLARQENTGGAKGNRSANMMMNSGGASNCCSRDLNSLSFFECVDNSACHDARHTVVIDLPCVEDF